MRDMTHVGWVNRVERRNEIIVAVSAFVEQIPASLRVELVSPGTSR